MFVYFIYFYFFLCLFLFSLHGNNITLLWFSDSVSFGRKIRKEPLFNLADVRVDSIADKKCCMFNFKYSTNVTYTCCHRLSSVNRKKERKNRIKWNTWFSWLPKPDTSILPPFIPPHVGYCGNIRKSIWQHFTSNTTHPTYFLAATILTFFFRFIFWLEN